MKISLEQYLMKRATSESLSPDQVLNADILLKRVDVLLSAYAGPVNLSSGYRPAAVNASVGGAAQSWHRQCAAIDLVDTDGQLWTWCIENLELCADLGLWLEDKRWTPTWVHLQIYPPKSGKRIFIPNTKAPVSPEAWNGVYDKKWDSKVIVKN